MKSNHCHSVAVNQLDRTSPPPNITGMQNAQPELLSLRSLLLLFFVLSGNLKPDCGIAHLCVCVCVWGDHWVIALLCFDSFPCSNRWKFRALIVGKLAALLLLFSSPDRLVQTRIPWRWYLINRPIFRAERGSFERGYYSGNGGALDCRWNSSSGNGLHWNYLQTVGDDPGGWSWSRRFFWLACGEDLKWYN